MASQLNKKGILFTVIVSAMLIMIALFFHVYSTKNETIKPEKGTLNLSGWDFNKERPSLAGEWEFYWNQMYTYSDFQSGRISDKQYVYVPKTWNEYKQNGKAIPGCGYATYRLKIMIDDTSSPLSLRIDTMSTAYRLFINDTEIASNGQVGVDKMSSKPEKRPIVVDFQPPTNTFDIIIQVSNFTYARGGIWYEINLGTPDQMESLNKKIIYKDALKT